MRRTVERRDEERKGKERKEEVRTGKERVSSKVSDRESERERVPRPVRPRALPTLERE